MIKTGKGDKGAGELVAAAMLEEPSPAFLVIKKRHFWERDRTIDLTIKPATMGTMVKISSMLLNLDIQPQSKETYEWLYRTAESNGYLMAAIIAQAIHNKQGDAPRQLVEDIYNNMTPAQLAENVDTIVERMDLTNFMLSIASVRSQSLMTETSLSTGAELIAPGDKSAA